MKTQANVCWYFDLKNVFNFKLSDGATVSAMDQSKWKIKKSTCQCLFILIHTCQCLLIFWPEKCLFIISDGIEKAVLFLKQESLICSKKEDF